MLKPPNPSQTKDEDQKTKIKIINGCIIMDGKVYMDKLSRVKLLTLTKLRDKKYATKPSAEICKELKLICQIISVPLDDVLDVIDTHIESMFSEYNEQEEDEEAEILDINISEIHPDFREEVMACVVFSSPYPMNDPPWLFLVGDPSTGKSHYCRLFGRSDLVHCVNRMTENALAPGKASTDQDISSVIERANNKTIIVNEGSTLLMGSSDVISKMLAIITDTFGNDEIVVSDPTGENTYRGRVRFMIGVTWSLYEKKKEALGVFGYRFLILPFDTNRSVLKLNDNITNRSRLIQHAILKARERNPVLMQPKDLPKDIKDEANEFGKVITRLRSATNAPSRGEHQVRLVKQLLNLVICRGALRDREPTFEDIKFFEPLAYETVPDSITLEDDLDKHALEITEMKRKIEEDRKLNEFNSQFDPDE